MLTVCIGSFYLAFFLQALLSNILFFLSMKYSEGDFKPVIKLKVIFDIIILLTLPLLMVMTQGLCG